MSSRFDYEKIDVVEFLRSLGVQNVRDQGLEVSYSCPFEGHSREDKNPSATMSKTTVVKNNGDEYPPTTFYCFACGRAGTAVTFLSEYENVSPLIARKMLREKFGMSFREPEGSFTTEIMSMIEKEKERYPVEFMQPEINEQFDAMWLPGEYVYNSASPAYDYMVKERGFTYDILNKFRVGIDFSSNRIAIPLRDEQNRLVGYKGRSYNGGTPKYLVLGGKNYDFDPCDVSLILFAYPKAIESDSWNKARELILTEGELNAISMHQKGYDNTVGISGQYLSDRQVDILKDDCRRIYLVFDEVEKAKAAARKLERFMLVYITLPTENKDPASMTNDEVVRMMNHPVASYLL